MKKISKNYFRKMLPRLCSPQPPSWGWVMGRRVPVESHPRRSTRTRELQCAVVAISLYLSKKPHLLSCGSICSTPTRLRVLVPSLFRFSAVVNLHFSCPKSTSVLSSCFSWHLWTWNCLQVEFSDNDRFKAGVHVKAVLTSLNTAFCQYLGRVSNNTPTHFINRC